MNTCLMNSLQFGDITCLDFFPMSIMLSKFEDHAQYYGEKNNKSKQM